MTSFPPLPREDLAHVLVHTRNLWEELRGKTVLITGGTGFFGIWLLESFAHANAELNLQARAVVLTRNSAAFAAKAPHLVGRIDIELSVGDVRDFAFPSGEFPFVVHAGTTSSFPIAPLEMFETIVDGTRRVLEFAATRGTRKLLFISSGAVYGRQPPELTHLPESYSGGPDPLEPGSAYGEGKRAAEWLCTAAGQRYGFETKIARCFAFVGPHLPLDAHFAIGNFIRDALRGGPIRVGGDGTPYRSYLYAADLAIWLWTLLFRGTTRRACNVGSARDLTISQVAQMVIAALDLHAEVQVAQPTVAGQPASRYVPAVRRATEELGLRDWVPLNDAIRKTAAWHREIAPAVA